MPRKFRLRATPGLLSYALATLDGARAASPHDARTVTFEGEKLREVRLRGGILPETADQTIDPKKVVVKPTLAGHGTYELAIDASVVKYPLEASGKITAVACE